MRLGYSVPPVQYLWRIVRVGGRLAVVAQWQSTSGSSQRCPGFDSQQLLPFSLHYFRLITSKFMYYRILYVYLPLWYILIALYNTTQ